MAKGRTLGTLSGALFLAMAMVVIMGEKIRNKNKEAREEMEKLKQWPDLSCHGISTTERSREVYKARWWHCLQREKKTGVCAKTCYISSLSMIYQLHNATDPVEFDIERTMHYVEDFLGYTISTNYKRVGPIELRLMACKKNHPEYVNLKGMLNTTCEPWTKILDCLDHAFGCVGNTTAG